MLIPKVEAKEFEKFGFKKCKGEYGKSGCYYLCVARGVKMLFVSDVCFDVKFVLLQESNQQTKQVEKQNAALCILNMQIDLSDNTFWTKNIGNRRKSDVRSRAEI